MNDMVENTPKPKRKRPQLPLPLGEVLNGYRLKKVIGRGGMGTVYLGIHELLGRQAAVKVLAKNLWEEDEFVSRFFHEAKVANRINHPNIVDILDFVHDRNPTRIAYIMELVDGPPLKRVLKTHRFTLLQAINVTAQLIEALRAAHAVGVIHRDLKPDNILLLEPLDTDLSILPSIKLLDFGIAKFTTGPVGHQTLQGTVLGTPKYMSPEQISAEPVSPATDIYALGEIFFELAAGRRVFNGENNAIMAHKLSGKAPELSCPDDLIEAARIQKLVTACLRLDPAKRISLDEFAQGLLEIRSATGVAADAPLTRRKHSVISGPSPSSESAAGGDGSAAKTVDRKTQSDKNAAIGIAPAPADPNPRKTSATIRLVFAVIFVAGAVTAALLYFRPAAQKPQQNFPPTKSSFPKIADTQPPAVPTQISITSFPKTATVVDAKSGKPLGQTPFTLLIQGEEKAQLILQAKNHYPLAVSVDGQREEVHFQLVEIEKSSPPKEPRPPKPSISPGLNPRVDTRRMPPQPKRDDSSPMKKKDLPTW